MPLGVKNLPANAGDEGDTCSLSGFGRSPGGGQWQRIPVFLPGESGQRSFMVCRVAKNRTQLKQLSTHNMGNMRLNSHYVEKDLVMVINLIMMFTEH